MIFAALPLFHTNALAGDGAGAAAQGPARRLGRSARLPRRPAVRELLEDRRALPDRRDVRGPDGLRGARADSRRRRHLQPEAADRRCRAASARRARRVRGPDRRRAVRGLRADRGHVRQRASAGPARPARARSASVCPTRRRAPSRSTRRPATGRSCPRTRSGRSSCAARTSSPATSSTAGSGRELRADGKVKDGWLDTGDLASVDADGFIRLAGRAKDLIIRGGHNIDPATIEDALLEHPDVTAAAAVGRPDPHAGEVPVAFVTLAAGSRLTADELEAWAADHVPERAAAPKHVEIVDEIPLTVGRQALQARAAPPRRRAGGARRARRDRAGRPGTRRPRRRRRRDPRPALGRTTTRSREALSQYAWTWKLTTTTGDTNEH